MLSEIKNSFLPKGRNADRREIHMTYSSVSIFLNMPMEQIFHNTAAT